MKTADAARGKWQGILLRMGIDDRYLTGRHTPCPLCGEGRDRFRFDDKNGDGSWICSHCGAGDGIRLVMAFRGWDFKQAATEIDAMVGNIEAREIKPAQDPKDRLRKIAQGLVPMDSINPVRLYLRARGLTPTKAIKLHPSLRHWDEDGSSIVAPAMVCLIQSADGKPLSYHITALTKDGGKAPIKAAKKIMPPVAPLTGGAIRLTDTYPHIGIAEGVETALAVMRDFQIPCWAAANATLLEKFEPAEGVRRVTVFGDNDQNYAGQKAAYGLAFRLAGRVDVDVRIPEKAGSDFADIQEAS